MKCPHCNSTKNWRSGWVKSKQGPIQIYRCKMCNRKFQERYLGSYIKGKHLTDEHKRKMSYALRRTYGKMTPEELKELYRKQQAGRERRPSKKHLSRQQRFIGMLGDIEVYAINFKRVGRSSQGLPNQWTRPVNEKPELKKGVKKHLDG